MKFLSEKLSTLRKSKNITMTKLAEDIGVSRSLISKYEKGERSPGRDIIVLLAEYFNVSTDYLLGKEYPNPEPPQSPTEKKFIVLARKTPNMSEKEHKEFIEFIENSAETFFRLKGIITDDDDKDKK